MNDKTYLMPKENFYLIQAHMNRYHDRMKWDIKKTGDHHYQISGSDRAVELIESLDRMLRTSLPMKINNVADLIGRCGAGRLQSNERMRTFARMILADEALAKVSPK